MKIDYKKVGNMPVIDLYAKENTKGKLDLNSLLVSRGAATFYMRVSGNDMSHHHILNGDLLIVDRSIKPMHNDIVIISLEGELVIRKFQLFNKEVRVMSEKEGDAPITLSSDMAIWGVVSSIIHMMR